MSASSEKGQRKGKRDSLFLSAVVCVEGTKPFTTRVRNLSTGGMMIDVFEDQVPGTPVRAKIRGIGEIAGRIAWSSPGRAGIAFAEHVDPRLARATPGEKREMPSYLKMPAGRRPGLAIR